MQDIHDIRPPVPVGIDPAFLKTAALIFLGIAILVLAVILLKKWLKGRRKPKDLVGIPLAPPPFEEAMTALDRLMTQEFKTPRLFYFDLTMVFRNYIGRSFSIHAVEMTSQEFSKSLTLLKMDKAVKKEILEFLTACDPIKYAGVEPGKRKVDEDLFLVRDLISKIEKDMTTAEEKSLEVS